MTDPDEDRRTPQLNGWGADTHAPRAGHTEEFPPAWAGRTEEFTAPWLERVGDVPPPWDRFGDLALPWAERHAGVAPPRVPRQRGVPHAPAAAIPLAPTSGPGVPGRVIEGTTVGRVGRGGKVRRGTRRRRWSRVWRVVLALVLVAPVVFVLAALATWRGGGGQDPGSARSSEPTSVLNTAPPLLPPRGTDRTVAHPTVLAIPSIQVRSALQPLSLRPDGSLDVPTDPRRAGWFAEGAAAGARGPAVLVGHVDSPAGPGVFFRLRELRAGTKILVQRADLSTVQFRVVRVRTFPKDAFPTQDVYGPTPGAELRLITCGGPFNRVAGSYRDNVVVFAVRA